MATMSQNDLKRDEVLILGSSEVVVQIFHNSKLMT